MEALMRRRSSAPCVCPIRENKETDESFGRGTLFLESHLFPERKRHSCVEFS